MAGNTDKDFKMEQEGPDMEQEKASNKKLSSKQRRRLSKLAKRKESGGGRKKYFDFIGEPMREKPVTDIPGVGNFIGKELIQQGFTLAKQVYDQFLQMDRARKRFEPWLIESGKATPRDAYGIYKALLVYYGKKHNLN